MIPLIVSKLKASYLASLVIFAGIAIPTSTIAVNQDVRDGIKGCFVPIIEGVNKVPEFLKEHVVEKGKEVIEKYKGWVNDAKLNEKFNKENAKVVTGGLKTGSDWLKKTKEFLSSKSDQLEKWAESGNYYTFEFSSVIKSAIDYLPTLSKDTVASLADKGKTKDYLSVPKMVSLFKAEGVKGFGKGLMKLYNKKPNAFKSISKNDTDTIFEIIKSLDDDNLPSFWTDAKRNMDEIENDSSRNYENDKDNIWKDIFIGKGGIQAIINTLTTLKGYESDENIKTLINGLPDVGENAFTDLTTLVNDLKTKLEELQKNTQSGAS